MEYGKVFLVRDSDALPLIKSDIKEYLKIDNELEDALLTKLAKAACAAFEKYTSISLNIKEYRALYKEISTEKILLPKGPLQQIKEVWGSYSNQNKCKLNSKSYTVQGQEVLFKHNTYYDQLEVIFTAGLAVPEDIPADIYALLLEHVAFLYENRGTKQKFDIKNYQSFIEYKL